MMKQFLRFELRSQLLIFFMLSMLALFARIFIRLQKVVERKALRLIRCIIIACRYTKLILMLIEAARSIVRENLYALPTNLHAERSGISDPLKALSKKPAEQIKAAFLLPGDAGQFEGTGICNAIADVF